MKTVKLFQASGEVRDAVHVVDDVYMVGGRFVIAHQDDDGLHVAPDRAVSVVRIVEQCVADGCTCSHRDGVVVADDATTTDVKRHMSDGPIHAGYAWRVEVIHG